MDFVKALLMYMTLTLASGLQAATPPGEKPEEPETAIVEMAEADAEATITVPVVGSYVMTPAPATPTPLPTITPNEAYTNLGMGDKGEAVKKLQARLMELGYLTGSLDGAYGYQTRNAVMLFQEANGLVKDGVAGRATQTRLFEDPDVIPNPAVFTPTPVPTATPDAQGLVPIPEDPMEGWVQQGKAQVMVNGVKRLVPSTGKAPRLWLKESTVILSLSDWIAAMEIDATATGGDELTFACEGYVLEAVLDEAAQAGRTENDGSFVQAYRVTVDGMPVQVSQGELMYQDGHWYATQSFFDKTLQAVTRWDLDELTLLMTIQSRALANAVD